MTIKRLLFSLACFCLAAALLVFLRLPRLSPSAHSSTAAIAQVESPADALFPGLDTAGVSAVSIITPQAAFALVRNKDHMVSVNGQRGDKDVFKTLLEHIAAMTFTPTEPFSAQDTPLLTMSIAQRGSEFAASFYRDSNTGEHARIIAQRGGTAAYGLTDGWRVGTLLLACEGTRIQDESGRETPMEPNQTESTAR